MTMYRLEMKPHVETDAQYDKRKGVRYSKRNNRFFKTERILK